MATVQNLSDVTPEELIQRAIEMRPQISQFAGEAEINRQLSRDFVEEVSDKDFFRIFLPKKFGGLEFDSATATRISLEWSSADASTGWVCGLGIVHQWLVAQFPAETHDEVWGENSSPMICGSYAPAGQMAAVDGGYRLTGEFQFSSGVDVSDWAILGVFFPAHDEDSLPTPGFTIVPKSDYRIEDNWHVMGLKGTGSKTIVCNDLFIPEYRRVTFAELVSGRSPGYQVLESSLYRYPILSLVAYGISTPAVGALNGAVDIFLEEIGERTTRGAVVLGGNKIRDFQAIQMRVGRAVANLKAAKAMLFSQIEESRAAVMDRGEILDVTARLDNRLTQAKTVELSVSGLDELFGAVGGNGIHSSQHVQRAWRDVHAISHHISFNWDALTSMYGQHLLGLQPQGQY